MTDDLDIPLDMLARGIAEVADFGGLAMAEALVQHFGGTRIWVPKKWHADHELNAIGEDLAQQLFATFGGDELSIPMSLFTDAGRRAMIRRLADQGIPHRTIARRLRCSQRVVRDELGRRPKKVGRRGRPAADHRQIDLIDYLAKKA